MDAFLRAESGMSRIDWAVIQLMLVALLASERALFTGDFGEEPAETAVQSSTETGATVRGLPVGRVFWLLGAVAAVIIIRLVIELRR